MAGTQHYAHPEFLVDVDWLDAHLEDSDVRIIDTDVVDQFRRAHIPGATVVLDHYEKDPDTNRVHILGPNQFAEMAQALGIGDDTLVVTYDNSRGLYAARLWWALNYYGHTNVKVLNGGWRQWLSQGRAVTTVNPKLVSDSKFTSKTDESLIVTLDQLKRDHADPETIVWDVRSHGEYTGEVTRGNKRSGHIPNAVHLEWLELVDDNSHLLKPADEVRRILETKGITPDKRIYIH
jgi:thiosulfate/3-mercaptopyruvate sulfurtransferase